MPAAAINIRSTGTTETPPHLLGNAIPSAVAPSPKVVSQGDDHSQRIRLFVGPMPMNVAAPAVAGRKGKETEGQRKPWWFTLHDRGREGTDSDGDYEDEVSEGHALRYFLQRGGREEEWRIEESLRKRTKRDMLRQWKQSGWATLSHHGRKGARGRKWVGQTFQVGTDFLGVPVQKGSDADSSRSTMLTPSTSNKTTASTSASLGESYHTAFSESLSGGSSAHSASSDSHNHDPRPNGSGVALLWQDGSSTPRRAVSLPRLLSSSSATGRVQTDGHSDPEASPEAISRTVISETTRSPADKAMPLRSAIRRLREDSRIKRVQFSPEARTDPPERATSPSEVLSRRPIRHPETSAGAAAAQQQSQGIDLQRDEFKYGDVILRDRMLVRKSHVKSGNIGAYLDEEEAIQLRDLHSDDWKELLVVWRKDQLELYENYLIPGKEMILGHKHLAFVIPLQRPDTRLSLYSFVDLTFCLTCARLHVPKNKKRTASSLSTHLHLHHSSGVDVFVFKAKTRTAGIDWMWGLWRQLGNVLPATFEVYCPAIETRVRLQVPDFDASGGEGYKEFTRDRVIEICRAALKKVPSWDYIVEQPIKQGARLELCWRRGSMLDWVRWETDVEGKTRDWAVLYGLCLRKPHEITHLEARIAKHHPTTVTLTDNTHLREPPAVEGYLYRIKPTSKGRAQVYLSTHGGCLFSINPARAQPPHAPIPKTEESQATEDDQDMSFEDQELQRGTRQILQADGFIDLRSIAVVRRAFQRAVPLQQPDSPHGQTNPSGPSNVIHQQESEEHDREDEGGDDVLAKHPNKAVLKMRRSFELLMRTGHVVRFETYSSKVALEWINHLSQLVEYWTHRHRVDARLEMDLIHAVTGNPGHVLAKPDEKMMPDRPPDYDQSSEYLPSFWHWCVLDRCLSVVRNGRLFLRRGLRGQYKLMQLVLVSGHLIQFHITSHGVSHHLRSKTTSLLDAYVCSGHFTTQSLPIDEFPWNRDPLPRRFQDGLEAGDPEHDTVFALWYRPHPVEKSTVTGRSNSSRATISSLNAKHKVLVLKARSRLERDAWCWVLNAEIERISRDTSERLEREG